MKIVASLLLTTLFAIRPQTRFQSPIESIARELLTNFAAGRFEAATSDFNDELRPVVTPSLLAEVKGQLDQQAGAFYMIKEAHQRQQDGFRAIELIAKFQKASVSVVVVFDPLNRVRAVYFNPILTPAADPALEAVAREVLANFTAGRYDDAAKPFDAEMRKQLSPEGMASLAASVTATFGTFHSVTEARQRIENGNRIIDLILSYTNRPVTFRVTFDAQGRVAGLRISPFKGE